MGEHKWLTEEQIEKLLAGNEKYARTGPELRLIADRREMRELLERLANARIVDEPPEAESIWDEINRMLRETAND